MTDDTPSRIEAAQRRDEMTMKWKRAGVALAKWGEAVTALFDKIRENAVTQKRFYHQMKDFYK